MSNPPTVGHGLISVIGRRRSMEDAFTVFPDLLRLTRKHDEADDDEQSFDFFAVFDGHGSRKVSHNCKDRLHHLVAEELKHGQGRGVDWQIIMASSFAKMDDELAPWEMGGGPKTIGSTALVVVVVGREEIVVANCGDCRVVVFRDDAALQLSNDHKPGKPDDKDIEEPGGELEVQVCKRNATDDFLVIGTNGLWDVMPNEMACEMVRKCFSGQVSKTVLEGVGGNCSAAAATMLAELAIARGSRDNISVIVVQLRSFDVDSSSFTK